MWLVTFQLHHQMRILLSPEHNISVTANAINCAFVGEENLCVECGIWECGAVHDMHPCSSLCQHPTIHMWLLGSVASNWYLSSCGLTLFTLMLQALLLISTSVSAHMVKYIFLHLLHWQFLILFKGKHTFLPVKQCHFSWQCFVKWFMERCCLFDNCLACAWSLVHSYACY